MRRRDLLSASQTRALELLERSLLGESRRVYVRVPLRSLIEIDPDDVLDELQREMLSSGMVDFLVVDRQDGVRPLFAVEFDSDRTSEDTVDAQVKELLLMRAGLPLLRVPDQQLGEKEQATLLEWVVDSLRFRSTNAATIRRRLDAWGPKAHAAGRPSSFAEALAVYALNPLPAITAIKYRLKTRYGLMPPLQYSFADGTSDVDDLDLTREALAHDVAKVTENVAASLLILDPNHEWIEPEPNEELSEPPEDYQLIVVRTPPEAAPKILYQTAVPMRWSGQHSIGQPAPPATATWIWTVDVALAEYLAQSEIERWANRALPRIDR